MRPSLLGLSLFALLSTAAAADATTLETVRARGTLRCALPTSSPGFGAPDSRGDFQGIDADICRAVAAAVFNDPAKVTFVATTSDNRFTTVSSGDADLLSRQTTLTFGRDTTLNLTFGPIYFYDGQGLMVAAKSGFTSARQLDGGTICLQPGTSSEVSLNDWFRANKLTFKPVLIENNDAIRSAFFADRCDALTSDRSDLASARSVAANPADYVVLPETLSKEPLAPAVRQGDDQWLGIVSWTVWGLILADEKGITRANVASLGGSSDPETQRILGKQAGIAKGLGLDDAFIANIVRAVGNYGEIYERTLGEKTSLGLTRGPNRSWREGGLLYAPPFR